MDDEKRAQLIGIIVEMLVKYGPTAIMSIAEAIGQWKNKHDPTDAEILALRDRVPRPEGYFE